MNSLRSLSRCILLVGVVLISTAGIASAQSNATLYEVSEAMKLRGRSPEYRLRAATAALSGTIEKGTTLCPADLAAYLGIEKCGVVAIASDNLSLASGTGPVKGSFSVVIQGDNNVDGYELVIARGNISGKIDLSQAMAGLPLGGLDGRWTAQGTTGGPLDGLQVYGRLSGVFRLPFVNGAPVPLYLLGQWPNVYPAVVQPNEHSLGVPAVRLDLNFETTGFGEGPDRDDNDRDRDGRRRH
jgi:hypothetical protein